MHAKDSVSKRPSTTNAPRSSRLPPSSTASPHPGPISFQSHIGRLDKGLDEAKTKGWTVVDMKYDWKLILLDFPTNSWRVLLRLLVEQVGPRRHVILVLDQAGWHVAKALKVPSNITLLHLLP